MSYFAGSGLQRTVDAVRACFQPERCGDFSSGFLVSEERRHCVCCRDLYSFKQEGSILCDFAVNGFNDIKAVDSLCKKAIFPYSKLTSLVMKDGTINESVLVEPMPEFSAFENQLADPRSEKGQPSLQDYRELMQLTEAWGLTNFQDLLIVYNICDVALMLLCVFTVNRFYFKSFGLSIMRYSSLSRFAYDCLLKGVYDKYGRGVETISSMEMLRFLEGGTFGGMSSVSSAPGPVPYISFQLCAYELCVPIYLLPLYQVAVLLPPPHLPRSPSSSSFPLLYIPLFFLYMLSARKTWAHWRIL